MCFKQIPGQPAGHGLRFLPLVAMTLFATVSIAEPLRSGNSPPLMLVSDEPKADPETIVFALMSGNCPTLKVAGRDFACRAVAFFQSEQGRANFAIALDDPTDATHIVTFSGANGRRDQDNNLYELQIDRMLLNSKDRPKADGLPVPLVELSAGLCRQLGNIATGGVSSVACTATDNNGKEYELQFATDGSPMTVRRVRRTSLATERRRAMQNEQRECRNKADAAKVLPRDLTAYIIGCLEDHDEVPAPNSHP